MTTADLVLVGVTDVSLLLSAGFTDPDGPLGRDRPFEGCSRLTPDHLVLDYDLHVWAYSDNPTGTFAQFNPREDCDPTTSPASAVARISNGL